MPLQVGLNLITLVMCIVTLTLATAALMPQITRGLTLIRDGLLWALLVAVLAFVGFIGWGRLYEIRQEKSGNSTAANIIGELFDSDSSTEPELDPLPLPTVNDAMAATSLNNQRKTTAFAANRSTGRRISSTTGTLNSSGNPNWNR